MTRPRSIRIVAGIAVFSILTAACTGTEEPAAPTQAQLAFFNGFLCIDPQGLQRFQIVTSPAGGSISEAVDYATSAPGGLNAVAGSSYHYQRWNRDPAGGGGNANFSNGLEIAHTP